MIIPLVFSCANKNNKEGFNDLKKLDYTVKYFPTNSYPSDIDKKIKNKLNPNFSDSLKNTKKVFLIMRYTASNSNKDNNPDTLGYFVSIRNDLSELFWEIDFNADLKMERSEEITFKEYQKFHKQWER